MFDYNGNNYGVAYFSKQIQNNNVLKGTVTKNLIPNISTFSRTERSVSSDNKRKHSKGNLSIDDKNKSLTSIEYDGSKRHTAKKPTKELLKTSSYDDLKEFIASGKKIDATILKRSGVRTDKRSGIATATEKVSGGSNALTSKVNNMIAANVQTSKPKFAEKKTSQKKELEGEKKQQQAIVLDKNRKVARLEEKNTQVISMPAGQEDDLMENQLKVNDPYYIQETNVPEYNRAVLQAQLTAILALGPISEDNIEEFDKFDSELGRIIKYVRIYYDGELNNDYFISVKPEPPAKLNAQEGNTRQKGHTGAIKAQQYAMPGLGMSEGMQAPARIQGSKRPLHTEFNNMIVQDQYGIDNTIWPPAQIKPHGNLQPQGQAGPIHEHNAVDKPDKSMSVVKQAMNKTLTGKLQRHIRKLPDEEKITIFKQLKGSLAELLVDQYARYVIVLFLKTSRLISNYRYSFGR